jgi:protein O-GlcNAc transferase
MIFSRFQSRWILPCILLSTTMQGYTPTQTPSAGLKEADADYRAGVAALNRNDLKTAQSQFEAVTRLAPSAEQGHSALGAVLLREGQWPAGIRELEKALALKPGDFSAQMNLAMAYAQSGAAAKSIPLFAKIEAASNAERHPLPSAALAAYARALATAGQKTTATTKMKEALAAEPNSAELHDELGSLYAQQKNWPSAQQEFSEAIRLKDDFAEAHLHLGFVLQAEQNAQAFGEWMQAYNLAPSNAQVALTVGKALADATQDEQAMPVLQHAFELAPASAEAAYQLAVVLQRTGHVPEAISLFKQVADADPKNADALANLGMALTQLHQATDAAPYLQRAIVLKPGNATAHQDLAAAYIQINQVADAIDQLKAAIAVSPDTPQLHYDLGVAYKLEDDATNAIPELEKAARLNPDGYEPSYVLGLLYMQVARYPEAAQQLEASLKLRPDNGDAWATLGSIDNKLDRLPEAVRALREAIRLLPEQADSHLILASVLIKQNQPTEAAAERKVAADLMRAHMNLQRAEVATNSGKTLLSTGKLDDAITQFRNAIAFDPGYAEAHTALADALEKQGKSVEAEAERAQAKSLQKSAQ